MNHRDVSSLIPWYVNGTLGESDRQQVAEHLRVCATCREDLTLETAICRGMTADSGVEYMPASSLKSLQTRIDRFDTGSEPTALPDVASVSAARHPALWRFGLAASTVAAVVVAGVLTFDWAHAPGGEFATFHTVTNADPRSPREVIRAVFAANVTLVELQSILDEAQLGIISGPTEAGVYSLEAKTNRPVSASLALLRQHATVRFAESTRIDEGIPGLAKGVSP